jgi:DNA end-binding protein Ku
MGAPYDEEELLMRAMWSGEIAFGLVTIPAKMYTATRDLTPQFAQLHTECGSKINYVRRCPTCARDVAWEEIGKGYEVSKGQFALFSKEELSQLDGDDAAGAIEIAQFVEPREIDPALVEKSYWIGPGGKSARGFFLLRDALVRTGKVAVAKTKIRTKTRLGILRPRGRYFSLDMMRFGDELVGDEEIPMPDVKETSDRERDLAQHLIDTMSGHFDPAKHPNEYRERVEALVAEKTDAGELTIDSSAGEPRAAGGSNVIDLVELLSQSLGAKGAKVPGGGPKKAAAPAAPAEEAAATAKPGPKKGKTREPKKSAAG